MDNNETTVGKNPLPQMTLEGLKKALAFMANYKDALEEKGIERDWVAVISPVMVRPLLQALENVKEQPLMPLMREEQLRQATGRKTYVNLRAPTDRIEYMTKEMYAVKYGKYDILDAMHRDYASEQQERLQILIDIDVALAEGAEGKERLLTLTEDLERQDARLAEMLEQIQRFQKEAIDKPEGQGGL